MRMVFLLFSLSILLLLELFFGKLGSFIPLVWFGCCYFGARERFFPAALSALFFGTLDWGICGREMMGGMLAALLFSLLGRFLASWRSSGGFLLCSGLLVFFVGGVSFLWVSCAVRGALRQEWGLLVAQTVFWALAGVPATGALNGILNWIAVRIGIDPEPSEKKGGSSWNA